MSSLGVSRSVGRGDKEELPAGYWEAAATTLQEPKMTYYGGAHSRPNSTASSLSMQSLHNSNHAGSKSDLGHYTAPPPPNHHQKQPTPGSTPPSGPMYLRAPVSSTELAALPPATGAPRSMRKMTAGSSPLAQASSTGPGPRPGMPTTLPPASVCECYICHSLSPYSNDPPPEIPMYQRHDLERLAPTCPSIHVFCMASRLPMSLPLDLNQKSPLARTILDYFYSTWNHELVDMLPRVQCINFVPIHPITTSSFDRYLESQPWDQRVCRPLWYGADMKCKLGMEGMYRNCMQDKCDGCFIFNDGFESSLARTKCIYLTPQASRAHERLTELQNTVSPSTTAVAFGSNSSNHGSANNSTSFFPGGGSKVRALILTFAALGKSCDIPAGQEKMRKPPKGVDVVHRMCGPELKEEEYGVFAADAVVPLAMILYKVI